MKQQIKPNANRKHFNKSGTSVSTTEDETTVTTASNTTSSSSSTYQWRQNNIDTNQQQDIPPKYGGSIRKPNSSDVLSGRGRHIDTHPGNVHFRELVATYRYSYLSPLIKKKDKVKIADQLVKKIRNMKPPGRFLVKEKSDGYWYEIGCEKARKKAGQAMREKKTAAKASGSATSDEEKKLPASPALPSLEKTKESKRDSKAASSRTSSRDTTSLPRNINIGVHPEEDHQQQQQQQHQTYEMPALPYPLRPLAPPSSSPPTEVQTFNTDMNNSEASFQPSIHSFMPDSTISSSRAAAAAATGTAAMYSDFAHSTPSETWSSHQQLAFPGRIGSTGTPDYYERRYSFPQNLDDPQQFHQQQQQHLPAAVPQQHQPSYYQRYPRSRSTPDRTTSSKKRPLQLLNEETEQEQGHEHEQEGAQVEEVEVVRSQEATSNVASLVRSSSRAQYGEESKTAEEANEIILGGMLFNQTTSSSSLTRLLYPEHTTEGNVRVDPPRSNASFSSSSTSRSSMSRRSMLGSRNDSFNSSSLQRADSIHDVDDIDDPMAPTSRSTSGGSGSGSVSIGHILAGDHASTTALNMMDQLDFSVQAKSSKSSSSSIHSSAMSLSGSESVVFSGSFHDVFDEAEMKSDF